MKIEATIEDLHKMLINKETTSEELIKESLTKAKLVQKKCNAFVTMIENR